MKPMKYRAKTWLATALLVSAAGGLGPLPGHMAVDAVAGASDTTTPAPAPTPKQSNQQIIQAKVHDAVNGIRGKFSRIYSPNKDKFQGSITLPLPNASLGLADVDAARNAELVLDISRDGFSYARCALKPTSAKRKSVKYAIKGSMKGSALTQKVGTCEVTITGSPNVSLAKPLVRDTLEIKLVSGSGEIAIANGFFVKK